MLEAVSYAIRASAIDCLRLLLPYATRQRPDGSYEYFRGEDFYDQVTFLLLGEAIEKKDDPALFRIVWETIVCHPDAGPSDPYSPSPCADGKPSLTKDEAIHYFLNGTAHHGRVETMRLIHEYYGADVNHISHPHYKTCLGSAVDAVKHDVSLRVAVVEYLLENTNADLTTAQGQFANGATPLFLAVTQQVSEMVVTLLDHGGPVESIDESLYGCIEGMKPGATVKVCVVAHEKRPRLPVEIWALQNYDKTSKSEQVKCLVTEFDEGDELLRFLQGLKIRSSDAKLLRTDPKGRPLATTAQS